MSNGKAKWYNDLAMVRERLDVRVGTLKGLIEPLKQLGLMDPLVKELELTVKVLSECANSTNNSIQEVSNTLNQTGLELQQAKEKADGPAVAMERSTGALRQFPHRSSIPEGWVYVVPTPALDGLVNILMPSKKDRREYSKNLKALTKRRRK